MRRVRVSVTLVMVVLAVSVAALRGCGVAADSSPGLPGGVAGGSAVATSSGSIDATGARTVAGLIEVRVSKNVDGDTIHVTMPDATDEKVRFIGVNTPDVKYVEVGRPMAAEARDANRGLWALGP